MDTQTKTTYTLEMLKPDDLRAKCADFPNLRIERMELKCPELNKFFHTMVGYNHRWGGRANWSKDDWYRYVNREGLETWIAYVSGTPAGYFEIEKRSEGDVQIICFGLLPQFIGKGLGGHLLTKAIEHGWEMCATKVWLSTCTHDHPHALRNYLARGFQISKTKEGPANKPIKSFWELMSP